MGRPSAAESNTMVNDPHTITLCTRVHLEYLRALGHASIRIATCTSATSDICNHTEYTTTSNSYTSVKLFPCRDP